MRSIMHGEEALIFKLQVRILVSVLCRRDKRRVEGCTMAFGQPARHEYKWDKRVTYQVGSSVETQWQMRMRG